MEVWVIKEQSGEYIGYPEFKLSGKLPHALFCMTEEEAKAIIRIYDLKRVKPVKVIMYEEGEL